VLHYSKSLSNARQHYIFHHRARYTMALHFNPFCRPRWYKEFIALYTEQLYLSTNNIQDQAAENIEACMLDCFEFVDSNFTRCEFELPQPSKKEPHPKVALREPCKFEGVSEPSSNPANLSFICMYSDL
jgi:hypothetical protein